MPLTQSSRVVTSTPKNWKNWKNNVKKNWKNNVHEDVEIHYGKRLQNVITERPTRPEH